MWLKFDMVPGDREHVSTLKCGTCIQFNERLTSLRNYNPAFINGSKNTRTSAFKEHADTEIHKRAMMLLIQETTLYKRVRVRINSNSYSAAIDG